MHTFTRVCLLALAVLSIGTVAVAQSQETSQRESLALEASPFDDQFDRVRTVITNSAAVVADSFYYEGFANGLAGWTFVNTNPDTVQIWEYETNPDLSADNGDLRYQVFMSPSVDNGFLWFDYRKYIQDAGIPIGEPPYPNLNQTAASPYIDMSNVPASGKYALQFYSYQPTLNIRDCRVVVRQGTDVTSDVIIWNALDDVARPNVATQSQQLVSFPQQFIGQDSVQLLFIHEGDFYGWAVDDIVLTQLPEIEPQVNDFAAVAPNVITPTSQAPGFDLAFIVDVQNNGAETITPRIAVVVADAMNNVVYTDTLQYPEIMTDSLDENRVFPMTAPMPTEAGDYTVTYSALLDRIDEDPNLDNNSVTYGFSVVDGLYSKTGGQALSAIRPSADNEQFGGSNIYYAPVWADEGGELTVDSITFAVQYANFTGSDEGFLELKVYGFRGDLNNDGSPAFGDDPGVDTTEMVELSLLEYEINADEPDLPSNAFITVAASEDGSVVIPNDEDYIGFAVGYEYFPAAGGDNDDNVFRFFGNDLLGGGYSLAADSLGFEFFEGTLNIPSRSDLNIFGYFTGSINLFDAEISYSPVGTDEVVLPEAAFAVMPNPASSEFTLNFDFGNAAQTAHFEVINAIGERVAQFTRNVAAKGSFTYPTQGMNNGLYYITVRTEDNQTATRRVFVKR